MNENITKHKRAVSESKAIQTYEAILNGKAFCHFTKEQISIDNLFAIFSIFGSEYKYCSKSKNAIKAYEEIFSLNFS